MSEKCSLTINEDVSNRGQFHLHHFHHVRSNFLFFPPHHLLIRGIFPMHFYLRTYIPTAFKYIYEYINTYSHAPSPVLKTKRTSPNYFDLAVIVNRAFFMTRTTSTATILLFQMFLLHRLALSSVYFQLLLQLAASDLFPIRPQKHEHVDIVTFYLFSS